MNLSPLTALWLLASATATAAPPRLLPAQGGWFYPDAGAQPVEVSADGLLGGVKVWRTGVVVARATSPEAADRLRTLPEVLASETLDPTGTLVWLDLGDRRDEFAFSRGLASRPDVHWAHPDLALRLRLHTLPNDPYVEHQWHLENTGQDGGSPGADIDAEQAWAVTTGEGVLVAIIDSGFDTEHPDLRLTCAEDDTTGLEDCAPLDNNGHGTAAAGLVAATGDNAIGVAGVAYGAELYGVRMIDPEPSSMVDLYRSFRSGVDAGAVVINNSWGIADGCSTFPMTGTLRAALNYAAEEGRDGRGTAVVFSAGNGGCDVEGDGIQSHPTVISVAAVDHNDVREDYSSYGRWVDVAAPSGGVLTTDLLGEAGYTPWGDDPDYSSRFSGTSAAAPLVSGTLALMFAANPLLEATEAAVALCATADRVQPEDAGYDSSGWSPTYGCGRINAGAAVIAVANTLPGEAVPLGPVEDPHEDRVRLTWAPAHDGDGDRVTYRVAWTATAPASLGDSGLPTEPSEPVHGEALEHGTELDLTGQAPTGWQVDWTVTPEDSWGAGPTASGPGFTILALEDAPAEDTGLTAEADPDSPDAGSPKKSGCTTSPTRELGLPALVMALVAFVGARRTRDRRRDRDELKR